MKTTLILQLLLANLLTLAAQQQFVVDRTFGATCGSTQTFFQANMYELLKLSNGKYLIVGDKFGNLNGQSNEILFARYNADGTVDITFSENGIKLFNFSNFNKVTSIAYVGNKIYIAGHQASGTAFSSFRASISRFNEDGTPDSTFNETGNLVENVFSNPISSSFYTHVLVQPDGKIVCFGFESSNSIGGVNIAVAKRYNTDGTVDDTFNNNPGFGYPDFLQGIAIYNSPGILESDGSMRFSYPAFSDFERLVSVKIDSSGEAVSTYGTNGTNITNVVLANQRIHRFLKSGNNIYGLHLAFGSNTDMLAYALDANGDADASFAGDGSWNIPNFPASGGSEIPFDMHLDSQNRLYFFGSGSFAGGDRAAFYRANLSGNLDSTLISDGSNVLAEFPFSEIRNALFENDSTIILNIFTNSRMGLVKLQLKSSNVLTSLTGLNTICAGTSTTIAISNPSDCYTYNWTKDGEAFAGNDAEITVTETGAYQVTATASGETSFSQPIVINVEDCTGMNEINASKITIYPNPAESMLNIKMEGNQLFNYLIYDISGRVIQSGITSSQNTLDIASLTPGIYVIHFENTKTYSQLKFIKK